MHLRLIILLSALSVIVTATMSVGCSQGSDIQLPEPVLPPPASELPSSEVPSTSPKDPATVLPTKYRILCHDQYAPYLTAISSLASSVGFGAGLVVDEAGPGLEYHENPQVIALPKFGEARILFSARRKAPFETDYTRFVFISNVDITTRLGDAKFLANEIPVALSLQKLAASESLTLKTFGVSDGGRYLLIGQGDGYKIVDSNSLATLGVLKVGSAGSNVNPYLRESDMMFTVASSNGVSFTSKLYSVGLAAGHGVKSLTAVSTVGSLRRPLVAVGADAAESFAGIDTLNRVLVLNPLKPSAATRSLIAGLPVNGRLASSAAFWRDSSSHGLRAAIVFENFISNPPSAKQRYRIDQAFVRALAIDESMLSADAVGVDFEYPADSKHAVEQGYGLFSGMHPGVRDLRATTDGAAVFGLFPGASSAQVYRLTSMGLDRVSQEACLGFSIGREL